MNSHSPNGNVRAQFALLAAAFHRRVSALVHRSTRLRVHAPLAMLLALLQRTPAERVLVAADEFVAASPIGALIRSTAAVAASLGAMHSLAGATVLSATTNSPASFTVGQNVQIGFTVTNTINIGSWKVEGSLPPGLILSAMEGGNTLTGPGTLDATTPGTSGGGYGGGTPGNAQTTPELTGKPTTAGNYTITLTAYELGGLKGLVSNSFDYMITIVGSGTAPAISTQPQGQSVTAGGSITLSVSATGSPAPAFQWTKNGTNISGATSSSLILSNVQAADAADYTVVVTNASGSVTSAKATVTVSVASNAPLFSRQPVSAQTVAAGTSAVFSADVAGAASYQWWKNGTAVAGATTNTLVLNAVSTSAAGNYTLAATNSTGTTTSSVGSLTVNNVTNVVDIGHLTNLSIRSNVGAGQILSVGFGVGGANTSGTKPLLVRAVGPTLTSYGVSSTDAMADPTETIFQGQTTVTSNDNWSGDATVLSRINSTGAFPFSSTTSQDAALAFTPAIGTYSVQIQGKNSTGGITLAEVYDATPSASFSASTPRLINVSALTMVGTGDNILVVGFYVAGSTARTVLIRATGPALTTYGVTNYLVDPDLQLYTAGANPVLIRENDNWGGDPQLGAAGDSVGAFKLNDPASKDAVLMVTLPPGLYSAEVKGVGNTTGNALIEVYEIP